jgi:ABC-2 type transport system permease protein
VLEGVVSPSFVDLVERIRSGAFDYVLLKPVDAQAMVSASRFEPWQMFHFFGAVAIAIYAFYQRGSPPELAHVAAGTVLFIAGVLAMYSLWILCAAASFWVVRLDNLTYLLGSIFDTARWPVQVFPYLWRFVFTFIIPVAVMTTYPAMALLGRLDLNTALATIGGALALLVISRLIWRSAIRSYTSASSFVVSAIPWT